MSIRKVQANPGGLQTELVHAPLFDALAHATLGAEFFDDKRFVRRDTDNDAQVMIFGTACDQSAGVKPIFSRVLAS